MGPLLLRLRTWWETADRTQRVVTIFGSAFLALLLIGTFYFASRPKMEMVFGGLSATEVGSVTEEIQKLGIPVEFDLQGNVKVPSSKVAEVRAKLATAGKLPASGHLGNAELSKLGMMNTPSVEREKLKVILEGELARSIEHMQGVGSARVHITLGSTSPFINENKPATASIFVSESAGAGITADQARAIALLVANAVPGLEARSVFVVDKAGRSLYEGAAEQGPGGRLTNKLQAEATEAARRERELQQVLDTSFGRGTTVVKVNLEMDFDETSERSVEPILSEPVNESNIREVLTENATTAARGEAEANTEANPAPITSNGGRGYESTTRTTQRSVGERVRDTKRAVGNLKTMAVAVLVNSDKIEQPNQVKAFLDGYMGPMLDDEGFSTSVTSVKFDTSAEEAAKAAEAEVVAAQRIQQGMSLLPILALIVVAIVVIRAISKAAKSQNVLVAAMPGGGVAPIRVGDDPAAGGAQAPAELVQAIEQNPPGQTKEEIQAIEEKLNKPLEQIKMLAGERPETVAMLIKSWLLEERR
jgi:flagellar M-ring protein FliF